VTLGSDAVNDTVYNRYDADGVSVSRFVYPLSGAPPDVIEDALKTVIDHHPGEVIWVQYLPSNKRWSGRDA
jgi:hypothetical protein